MRALKVLVELNRARASGDLSLARALDERLEELDARGGFSRSAGLHFGKPVGSVGQQRNPQWREALDRLNERIGR